MRKKRISFLAGAVALCLMAQTVCAGTAVSNGEMKNEDIIRLSPVEHQWSAKWIWGEDNTSTHNWLCARKTVTIEDISQISNQVLAMISADTHYWLWINGKEVVKEGSVKRGPTQNDSYMEYVDITSYLQEGENTIAILGWYFGSEDNSYSYHSSGQGGILFEADLGNGTVITSDDTWKVKKHEGYLLSTEENNPGSQGNFRLAERNILYDASAAEDLLKDGQEDWMNPDYDDSSWENAVDYGDAGCAPWNDLYERSIPQLAFSKMKEFENPEEYEPYISDYTTEEVTLNLELPGNIQMTPVLELDAKEAGLKIDMTTSGVSTALRASYITTDGYQKWECLGWMSTQYLTVTIPAGVKIEGIYYYQSGYDADQEGSFTCDDDDLTQLWQESYNTLAICMRDTYMDCPDRERAQWWGDVTSQMQESFYVLSESANLLYRKGVDTVIGWTDTDENSEFYNVLQTVVPAMQAGTEYPQQELYGITGFWTYYLYTGEKDLLEEVYKPAVNYLKFWNMQENGLIETRNGTVNWADWGKNADSAILENGLYYWALKSVKNIADVLDITEDEEFLDERMNSIESVFNDTFWNGEAYYYQTSNELPDDRAQAIPVLAGLADEDKYEKILDVVTTTRNASPYYENFIMQAMYEMGYDTEVLDRLKEQFGSQLTDEWTTLGEFFEVNLAGMAEEDIKKYYDPTHNHAWASCALVGLSGYGAGVSPTAAGYETWQIAPQMGSMNEIDCTVPSKIGAFEVRLQKDENGSLTMQVTVPGGKGEVWVPVEDGQECTLTDGNAEFKGVQEKYNKKYAVYEVTEAGSCSFEAK